ALTETALRRTLTGWHRRSTGGAGGERSPPYANANFRGGRGGNRSRSERASARRCRRGAGESGRRGSGGQRDFSTALYESLAFHDDQTRICSGRGGGKGRTDGGGPRTRAGGAPSPRALPPPK